jgi:hypothetical protein
MTHDVTNTPVTDMVDDADLLAILAEEDESPDNTVLEFLLSPNLPELQSDDEGSELSLTLLDDDASSSTPSRKRSREDFEEDDADPFGFELLDVIQLEDPPHLAKKAFVNDEELSLDFLDDFESSPDIIEPFITV